MRLATLLAAAVALAAVQPALAKTAPRSPGPSPAAAPADPPSGAAASGDPTVADMRCIVVAGALLGSDDEQMKSLGRANLFYFLGRLQGRGDTVNMNARVIAEATKMTEDDIKTQAKSCGATFTAAAQSLQDMSKAFEQHFGAPGGGAGGAGPTTK